MDALQRHTVSVLQWLSDGGRAMTATMGYVIMGQLNLVILILIIIVVMK